MIKIIISGLFLAVAIFSLNSLNDIERYSKSEVAVEKSVPVVVSVIGDPCDDGKEETINDIYLSSTGLCVGLIERDEVTCKGDKIGSEILVNGEIYLVADNKIAKENLDKIETLCLSNVTDPEIVPFVVSVIGDPCDDGKEETINDIYLNNTGLCAGIIERDEVTCKGDKIGSEFLVGGEVYLVADNKIAKENLNKIETLCLSNVTDPEILELDYRKVQDFELEDSSLKHN